MRTAKCVVCGKEFTTRHWSKCTCSEECSEKRHKMVAGVPKIEKVCEVCGKPFLAWKPKQPTCSRECSKRYRHMGKYHETKAGFEQVDMRLYHSESLDRKAKKWGYNYGKKQSEETLDMVGRVDVNAILAELKGQEQPVQEPKLPPRPAINSRVFRQRKCAFCGKLYERYYGKKYCSDTCRRYAKAEKINAAKARATV